MKYINQEKFQSPPLYQLNFAIQSTGERLSVQISQKLSTDDLLCLLSNILAVPKEKIGLRSFGKDIGREPLAYLHGKSSAQD